MNVLEAMTEAGYAEFVAEAIPSYAAEKVTSGQWSADESLELSRKSLDELLPKGLASENNYLYTIHDVATQVVVGHLWIAVQERAGARIAYVYEVNVKPAYQRAGHASRAFAALESEVRRMGLAGIALHVFGHNHAAHAMYQKLGYLPTNINMYKSLTASQP